MRALNLENIGKSNRRVTEASLRTHRDLLSAKNVRSTNAPTRLQALDVCKRYASAIGLKTAKIALIDQLFAFTSAKDWDGGSRLKIIWPTNEVLARRLGIKVSTLKYHLAGLVEAMLINYSDHPTYQRKGYRDDDGHIVEGYGIDLSPIAIRYSHMLEVAASYERGARELKQLSYTRTSLRRQIEAIVRRGLEQTSDADGGWEDLHHRLLEACSLKAATSIEVAKLVVEQLETLRNEAIARLENSFDEQKIDSAVTKFRPLQTTEDFPETVSCNERSCADAQQDLFEIACGETAFEDFEVGRAPHVRKDNELANDRKRFNPAFDWLPRVMPNLFQMVPEIFRNHQGFFQSGQLVCKLCYINPQVYTQALSILGNRDAMLALAITAERCAAGQVENPGGYLRAMIERAREGKLHLDRSLKAMMVSNQAPAIRERPHNQEIQEDRGKSDGLFLSSSTPSRPHLLPGDLSESY